MTILAFNHAQDTPIAMIPGNLQIGVWLVRISCGRKFSHVKANYENLIVLVVQ